MNALFFLSEIDDGNFTLELSGEDYFFSIVSGIVIGYYNLEWMRRCLTKQAIYRLSQIMGTVVRGNDD